MKRNESLDALRGFAILTMILSGSIAYGDVLPAWMFHAQVPPPAHRFDPSIPGITWVDLVFPFFLFSMGAAIPLALRKHLDAGKGAGFVLTLALKRFLLLTFFALFTNHMKAWVIAEKPGAGEQLLSLLAFALLFFQFYEYRGTKWKKYLLAARLVSFALALYLLWSLPFRGGKGFDWYHSDIIILVLANMAFFGTLLYYVTAGKPVARLAALPFVMAVFLAAKEPGNGWTKDLFLFDHIGAFRFDWLYKFYFLKYLFIILPGTLAGEWMLDYQRPGTSEKKREHPGLALAGLLLVVLNLYGLFTRQLLLNLLASAALCGYGWYRVRERAGDFVANCIKSGSYLLLLGLFFEAYEGGIRKDPSTYSYYFVTGGLAFWSLVVFTVMSERKYLSGIARYLSLNGRNPMVAYVAGNLVLLPLLELTRTKSWWDAMNTGPWMGFAKGLLFTGLVSLLTVFFVRRNWYWKT